MRSPNQVIITTLGDLVYAKRHHAGVRATQRLGQMTEEPLQALSRQHGVSQASSSFVKTSGTLQSKVSAGFEDAYRAGQKLGSCAT